MAKAQRDTAKSRAAHALETLRDSDPSAAAHVEEYIADLKDEAILSRVRAREAEQRVRHALKEAIAHILG